MDHAEEADWPVQKCEENEEEQREQGKVKITHDFFHRDQFQAQGVCELR